MSSESDSQALSGRGFLFDCSKRDLLCEEETRTLQEESYGKKAESSERTTQGLERNRQLSRSTNCGGAEMGQIRHACDAGRQVYVCISRGIERIPRAAKLVWACLFTLRQKTWICLLN
jgi:hypothetical protein